MGCSGVEGKTSGRGETVMSLDAEWDSEFEKLIRLSQLAKNWDSYGAAQITVEAIVSASKRMRDCKVFCRGCPVVVPMTDGGIQLEWIDDEREVIERVFPDGTIKRIEED